MAVAIDNRQYLRSEKRIRKPESDEQTGITPKDISLTKKAAGSVTTQ